jgi:putative transcriptional regulator
MRFDTLAKLCRVLDCQPGDLIAFDVATPDETD